ncbi:3584_t:CDS:10 [Dentiscutata erythropus]|uniref:3584_t:CDS:1 n=1 Tax=Dentiscutata erythropus TaxID=1348616 RepID=A0A9N9C112_9GLOM|nr:3584_t:CDS:10 [Dentiscutata erythropus]
MVGLHEIIKKRILNAIKSVNAPGGWKVVVVDDHSLKVIESTCKTFDILEEKVTLVENLQQTRQPNPSFDAVYIITPSHNSVEKVIEDFTRQKPPLYAGAHIFFISPPDDPIFQRLRSSLPPNFLKSFEILYIDFHVRESQVYSLESPSSFFKLYSPDESPLFDGELRKLAKQLLSVCVSLGEENPLIRFQRGIESDHATKELSLKLAQIVQAEFDEHARNRRRQSPPQDIQRPRAVLFIVDRSIDMYTPILHEFTYQAMANDVLQIENGRKFTYNYTAQDGSTATKDAILDESDTIWVDIRHKHMKDCIDQLKGDLNKFLEENSTITNKDKEANLNDMKKMLATLPQFQDMKDKYSVHLSIAHECMNVFDSERLPEIATIEQNCATGYTSDGRHPKTLVEDMVPLLDSAFVSSYTKVRVLMLYMMYKNGILEEDRRKLLAHARISLPENDAINNLTMFGVKLIRSHINKTIDHTAYPYTRDPTGDPDEVKVLPQGPVSLRSARAGWSKKGQTAAGNPRIIVFVAGGVTYSELRSAYELSNKYSRDVVIGSSHITTPQQFIDDLKRLRRHPNPNQSYSSPQSVHTPPSRAGNQNYGGINPSSFFNRAPSSSSSASSGGYHPPQQGGYFSGSRSKPFF